MAAYISMTLCLNGTTAIQQFGLSIKDFNSGWNAMLFLFAILGVADEKRNT